MFEWNNNNWVQKGEDLLGENAEDLYGVVALSDDGSILGKVLKNCHSCREMSQYVEQLEAHKTTIMA